MAGRSLECTTKTVRLQFTTLGHALYLRELWQPDKLQRQLGILMPVSDWLILLAILSSLIKEGQLVAYLDEGQGIGIVDRDLWLSDVAAEPQLKELQLSNLPCDPAVLAAAMLKRRAG